MAGINPQAASGGRVFRPLLEEGGADFDGITSTTDTTISSEAVFVPEGYQVIFVMDIDTYTTAALTQSIQFTLNGQDATPDWHDYYWDRASATAATSALTVVGHQVPMRAVNPFPTDPTGNIQWKLALKSDGSDTVVIFGDSFLMVVPVPYANPKYSGQPPKYRRSF